MCGRVICIAMCVKAAASLMPSRCACCGVIPVMSVASGEGSRSSAGLTRKLIGSSMTFNSVSVRTAANCAMRVRRGS